MNNNFKKNLLKILLIIGGASSIVNVPILYQVSIILTNIVIVFSLGYIIIYILYTKDKLTYDTSSNIALIFLFIQTLNIPIYTGVETFFLPWMLLFPIVIFNLKARKVALTYSLFLFIIFLSMFFLSYLDSSYITVQIVIFSMLYSTVVIVFYFINKNVAETEKKLSTQNIELQKQKELYDLVFENSSNGVLLINQTTGKFTACNNKIVEILKYNSKQDILNLHPSELSPLKQPNGIKSDIESNKMIQLAIKKGSNTFEWKHLRATGEEFWAEITLTSIIIDTKPMIHVVWKDIDERKSSREALESMNITLEEKVREATYDLELKNSKLQELVDNFQNLLDTTMEGIVFIDENRNVIDVNQSIVTMLGYTTKSEIIGTHITKYVLASELKKLQEAMMHAYTAPYELILLKKDGTAIPTLASARNITREGKQIRMSTIMDLSDIKQSEKLLQQQARLAQMGEMISMIAHQWRQPLGAISSAIIGIQTKQASKKYNLEKKEDREKFIAFIDTKHSNINEYVRVLSNTIDDFRNFFKPNKDKELVTLTTPILRALEIVSSSLSSKNITIETKFNNDDTILIYANEMMQVVLNILKNAEDNFLTRKILNPIITITTEKEKGFYILSISDNGGGISKNIMPHIFNPYFSTKDEKNGTGIGLYMSKIMTEEHNNGKLIVKNTDIGVIFKILLKRQ